MVNTYFGVYLFLCAMNLLHTKLSSFWKDLLCVLMSSLYCAFTKIFFRITKLAIWIFLIIFDKLGVERSL